MPKTYVNRIVFLYKQAAVQFNKLPASLFLPVFLLQIGVLYSSKYVVWCPSTNRIALSDLQAANLFMYVNVYILYITNRKGNLSEGGTNQPIKRPGKIVKFTKNPIHIYNRHNLC